MKSIFISYSSKDIKDVNSISAIANKNLSENIDLWIASEKKNDNTPRIPTGEKWPEEIKKGIEHSDGAVLLVSKNFLVADIVRDFELPLIIEKTKENPDYKIYPILLDDCNFREIDFIKERNFSNTPSTNLKALQGRRYNLEVEKLISDINRDFQKKSLFQKYKENLVIVNSLVIAILLVSLFSRGSINDSNNEILDTTTEVTETTTEVTEITTESSNDFETDGKLQLLDEESLNSCIESVELYNLFLPENIIFAIESNPYFLGKVETSTVLPKNKKNIYELLWSSEEEINEYIDSLFNQEVGLHVILKETYYPIDQGIEPILLLNNETINELLVISNSLNNDSETDYFSKEQIDSIQEIIKLLDESYQKLNWFYKVGDGDNNETSMNYLKESEELYRNAILKFSAYASLYLLQEDNYSRNQITKICGDVDLTGIDLSKWEDNLTIISFFRQKVMLFDLEKGDCGMLLPQHGYSIDDPLLIPQYWVGDFSRVTLPYGQRVGVLKDRFPSYRYIFQKDCSLNHNFEVGPTGFIDSEEYGFDPASGLPETWWRLDFYLMMTCMMQTTEYLSFPFEYTGYSWAAIVDTRLHNKEKRKYMCLYYKNSWDDLGQLDGMETLNSSIRLIDERVPKIEKNGWLFIDHLLDLDYGSCWSDPLPEKFNRALIHNSSRTDYSHFTYLGYNYMEVKVVDCDGVHQNQIIYTGLIDKSNYKNENELKSYSLAFCEDEVSKVIRNFKLTGKNLDEYGERELSRDEIGLDVFIEDFVDGTSVSLICSVYPRQTYSNILHPPGWGDEFIDTVGYSYINNG